MFTVILDVYSNSFTSPDYVTYISECRNSSEKSGITEYFTKFATIDHPIKIRKYTVLEQFDIS